MARIQQILQKIQEHGDHADYQDDIRACIDAVKDGSMSPEDAVEHIAGVLQHVDPSMSDVHELQSSVSEGKLSEWHGNLEYSHPRLKKALIYGAGVGTLPAIHTLHKGGAFAAAAHLVGKAMHNLGTALTP